MSFSKGIACKEKTLTKMTSVARLLVDKMKDMFHKI